MTRIKLFLTVFSLGLLFVGCEAESLDEALETQNAANLEITKQAAIQDAASGQTIVTTKSGDDDDKPGMGDDGESGDDDDKPGMDDGRSSGDDDDKPGMDDGESGDDDDKPGMDDGESGDDDDKPGMDDSLIGTYNKSGDDDDKPGMDDN